jgi:hypothetical protein
MSIFKFVVSWQEDDSVQRDIEILSSQTYYELHTAIKTYFLLPEAMEASIFVSDDEWKAGKEISSIVEKNLRDAPSLSMKRTPLGALINEPHQKHLYVCDHVKSWIFQLELIKILPEKNLAALYPVQTRSEGISPTQLGVKLKEKDAIMDIVEKFDLTSNDGFGSEGEDEGMGSEDSNDDMTEDSNYTDDL